MIVEVNFLQVSVFISKAENILSADCDHIIDLPVFQAKQINYRISAVLEIGHNQKSKSIGKAR